MLRPISRVPRVIETWMLLVMIAVLIVLLLAVCIGLEKETQSRHRLAKDIRRANIRSPSPDGRRLSRSKSRLAESRALLESDSSDSEDSTSSSSRSPSPVRRKARRRRKKRPVNKFAYI